MPYTLSFINPNYEPYTNLEDEEDVYEAIKGEAENVVNTMGSEILPDPTTATREKVIVQLAVEAKEALWIEELDEHQQSFKFPDGTTILLKFEED